MEIKVSITIKSSVLGSNIESNQENKIMLVWVKSVYETKINKTLKHIFSFDMNIFPKSQSLLRKLCIFTMQFPFM